MCSRMLMEKLQPSYYVVYPIVYETLVYKKTSHSKVCMHKYNNQVIYIW